MTFEFIEVQIQYLQVFQISEGLRDAPYRERGQKKQRNSDGQWGLITRQNEKNVPESWFENRYNCFKFARLPKDAGMLPA